MDNSLNNLKTEIILGVVSPIGTDKIIFESLLKSNLKSNKIRFIKIKATDELININKKIQLPKSLSFFLKMQICSTLRENYARGIMILNVLSAIQNRRSKLKGHSPVVYIIDQLKNVAEREILRHIYGNNYFQISLFSNENDRNHMLEKKFEEDPKFNKDKLNKNIANNFSIKNPLLNNIINPDNIETWLKEYVSEISKDCSHMLIVKDFEETTEYLKKSESGQQVVDLFHSSDYFINLDAKYDTIGKKIECFLNLLLGKNKEYPSQDEFGMSLAYQASVRSNFPGGRQVGASIISEFGEVISVASIRAPSKSSNTTLSDEHNIDSAYWEFKKLIDSLVKLIDEKMCKGQHLKEKDHTKLKILKNIVKNNLDFHPCTHAEISAVIDAAKLGVSPRNSTLYTTTFPCHICAKDIINAGIKRVVYLEAYPKSKCKELYLKLIDINPKNKSDLIPFDFYCGISPRDYLYFYSLENSSNDNQIPLLQYEVPNNYKYKEDSIIKHINMFIKNKSNKKYKCKNTKYLCKLIHSVKKKQFQY